MSSKYPRTKSDWAAWVLLWIPRGGGTDWVWLAGSKVLGSLPEHSPSCKNQQRSPYFPVVLWLIWTEMSSMFLFMMIKWKNYQCRTTHCNHILLYLPQHCFWPLGSKDWFDISTPQCEPVIAFQPECICHHVSNCKTDRKLAIFTTN